MKRLVLAGAGHAHALVLLDLVRAPLRGVAVEVVSPLPLAPYSGMVPGWLAGLYGFDEIVIDFPRLCAAAGARWHRGELHSVDAPRQRVRLADGEELPYDLLSLNVGSTLRPPPMPHATALPLRPLSELHERYERLLAQWAEDPGDEPLTVTAVGGGAAGFESLLAVLARLRRMRPGRPVHGALMTRAATLLPGLSTPARRAAARALQAAGVTVQLGSPWCDTSGRGSQVVLWATGAEAHDWQRDPARRGALAVDDAGFVRVDKHLRSVSHPQVFASGDCARWDAGALPKAGVFAVRMGPVLAHNLRATLAGTGAPGGPAAALRPYHPQRHYLVLLATGDRHAIASRGPFGLHGAWAWRWKDHIDRRFVDRFRVGDDGGRRPPARPAVDTPPPPAGAR